jgi:hypothetical protein
MPQAEQPPAATPSRWKRHGTNIVRLILIALIIWTSYWAAKTVKRIMAGPQNPVPVQDEANSAPPTFEAVSETPEPGFWAFEKQDWAISQTKISPKNFEQHLLNRLKIPAESFAHDQDLLSNFQRLGSPTAIGENGHLYRASPTGGPFAVSRGAGTEEQLIAAGFIMPEANGDWLLLEMLPTPNAVRQKDVSAESLLPLPKTARRLMSRWSNSGKLILDWVHVPLSGSEVVQQWQASGLKLRKTAGILGAESSYLYEQNGEVIIVNTFPSTEGGVDLLITRSSDVQPSTEAGTTEPKP